jgi:hypothetical protein
MLKRLMGGDYPTQKGLSAEKLFTSSDKRGAKKKRSAAAE